MLFDGADAFFGKGGRVKDNHDRWANQHTGCLLQQIEW
jgi:hypothetical protein